jgi:hypothetical protein
MLESKNSIMKRVIPLLALVLVLSSTACNKPVSLLVVIGGHSYDTVEFSEMLGELEGVSYDTVVHPEALPLLGSDRLDEYDVVAFYDFIPDMAPADSGVFLNIAEEGKPMLFLHHSICTFQHWDGYMEMVGGRYIMPAYSEDTAHWSDYKHDIDLSVQVLDPDHPVTSGVENFVIHDEGYSNLSVIPGTTPLLRTDHPDSFPLIGWTHQYGNSTIVYLMLGHDKMAYEHPGFRKLVQQSIHWLASEN